MLIYESLILDNPTDGRANARLGWAIYKANGSLEDSLAELNKAIEISPEDPEGYIRLGYVYMEEKEYLKAEVIFQMAREKFPSSREVIIALADNAMASEDYGEAISTLHESLEFFPDDAYLWYRIADIYFWRINEAGIAKVWIEKALDETQQDPRYWLLAGRIYKELGSFERAAHAFQETLKINPSDEVAERLLKMIQQGS